MLFRRLKDADPSFTSGWFVYWPGLNDAMPHGADEKAGDWSDANTVERSVDLLRNGDPDALFVHLGAIDAAGHASGFDPDKAEYLASIEEVDGRVGEVLSALKSRPGYRDEHWMILALTDHGGLDTHHGGSTIEEMRVFFIVAGDEVPRGREVPHEWAERTLTVPPYGLKLDGSDDCVSIPDSPDFHFGADRDFSIEICVKTSGWSGTPVLFANKDCANDANPGFALMLIDEGKWRVNAADGSKKKNISGPVIADGRWHHLAAVFRTKGTLSLFQDGIKTGRGGHFAAREAWTRRTASRSAGTFREPIRLFAPVSVNEIRLWKTALPDSVVRNWIFTPVTTGHSKIADLAGYWKMDDGGGTRIADSGPSAGHGRFAGTDPQWIRPQATVVTLDFDSSTCRQDRGPRRHRARSFRR